LLVREEIDMSRRLTPWLIGILLLGFSVPSQAQPTYRLSVKPELKPLATLSLTGETISRTELVDDPGFRLQYAFKKDGKPLSVAEARSQSSLAIPDRTPGTYTVVLELFYPAYKGGTQQKGEFKPVSNVLEYQVKVAQPGGTVQVIALQPPAPPAGKAALIVQCGKGGGNQEKELLSPNYEYRLVQGMALDDWKPPALRSYRWADARMLRIELTVPVEVAGTLRLLLLDGDNGQRKQQVLVENRTIGDYESFQGEGKTVEASVTAADTKDGRLMIEIRNLNPMSMAVVSLLEFVPVQSK
jgi:hypothetical protein